MSNVVEFRGSKGGSSTKTPVESPNTLRSISYFHIVDLLSEGEIGGLVNGLQSVYLADTPVANADGSLNFTGFSIQQRTGTQDQEYIPGFSSVENEVSINTVLTSDTPWARTVSDVSLSAVRITLQVDSLQKTNTKNGNIDGYTIQYAIDVATDGGAYNTVLNSAFSGKTSGPYQRSHRIDLPTATTGWSVRVRRLTANANSATIGDTTRVVSYTEIVDAKLRYPNSAIVAVTGDASQFQSIPSRAYEVWGRIIQVPANYDPTTRAYTGTWDGSFKAAWTNNPAWVLYDVVTNNRFGLGDLLDASLVDKWELYRIAQYCDELVDDGSGGKEPRFTCNTYLQSQEDAFKLLGDLSSVFRGISYWMGGAITPSADMPSDPVYTYTAGNVIDGLFTYQSSARKTRYTTALVTWNDPANAYGQSVEYVEDQAGLARYGIQQTEFVAFGCTSQGQAHRAGQWALVTSRLETDSVSFDVGLDGLLAAPGQIIRIADPARAGARQGGRISSATASSITVDRIPDVIAAGDTLSANLPDGTSESHAIASINGKTISIQGVFSAVPQSQSVWAVESATLAAQTFRILNVVENQDQGQLKFTISAVQHVAGKFAFIDDGTLIQIPPISRLPTGTQAPPANVRLSGNVVVEQGIATNVMTIEWDAPAGASQYKVEWQKDSGQWIQAGTVSTTSIDVIGVYTGTYVARVTAYNSGNTPSLAALSQPTEIQGKTGAPPSLTSLTTTSLVFGIRLDWGFPAQGAEDVSSTQIYYNQTNDLASATELGEYSYPTNTTTLFGLAAGVSLFFWGRLVDKAGNIGAWYPLENGVNGQSSSDATEILQYISGQIDESALAQELRSKIDSIDSILPVIWQAGATYSKGDIVANGGHLYAWTTETAGNSEPPGADWQDVGTATEGYGALVGQVNQNTTNITNVDNQVTAQGTQISGLTAQLNVQAAGDPDWGAGDTTVYAGTITIQSVIASGDLAQAQRTDTLQAQLGQNSASIQTTQTAMATLQGQVSASYSVRLQVTADGQYVAAGFGLSLDNASGYLQSQFLVAADRFAIVPSYSAGGSTLSPFVVQGGQVFINQAFIGDGWITNAKIGNQIASTALVSSGAPVWELNKSGTRYARGEQFTIEEDSTSWRLYQNGVSFPVVELGNLS